MPGPYTDQLLTTLAYQDGTAVAKVGGAMGGGVNFKAPLTATANGSTGNVDVAMSGSPTLGAVTATSVTTALLALGSQTPPQYETYPGTTVLTTGPEILPLTAWTFVAGKLSVVTVDVIAWIATSTTAFGYTNNAQAGHVRIGSAAPVVPVNFGGFTYANATPAAPFAASGSQGSIQWNLSGNTATLYAEGINTPSAWAAGPFTVGALVTRSSKVYGVISISGGGTSVSGPSGTGTTTDNAGANQVVWDYIGPGTAVPITWCANRVQVFSL